MQNTPIIKTYPSIYPLAILSFHVHAADGLIYRTIGLIDFCTYGTILKKSIQRLLKEIANIRKILLGDIAVVFRIISYCNDFREQHSS